MKRLYKAFLFSIDGIKSCLKTEPSFRLELFLFVLAVPAAFYLGNNKIEVILLIGSGAMVMVVELLNSSIENTANRIGMEYHPLVKDAKDQGSAAVLLTSLIALFTWIYILFF